MYNIKSPKNIKTRLYRAKKITDKQKTAVARRFLYSVGLSDYSADSSLCGFILSMILAFISSATSLFWAR